MKDIFDFYKEISFVKSILWFIFTFIWIIVTFLLTAIGTGYYDAVIERTTIYFFYIFWLGLSIATYTILYKFAYKNAKKKIKSFSMCIVAIVLLFGLSWGTIKVAAISYSKFSEDIWKESKNVRKYMIYDLINNGNVIGMGIDDAIKLLGPPESYYDSKGSNSKGIVYFSGRRTYSIIFWLDDNKIVGYTVI